MVGVGIVSWWIIPCLGPLSSLPCSRIKLLQSRTSWRRVSWTNLGPTHLVCGTCMPLWSSLLCSLPYLLCCWLTLEMFLPSTHRYVSIPTFFFHIQRFPTTPLDIPLLPGVEKGHRWWCHRLLLVVWYRLPYGHNYASFLVLQRLSPVTHAGTLSLFTYTLTLITQQTHPWLYWPPFHLPFQLPTCSPLGSPAIMVCSNTSSSSHPLFTRLVHTTNGGDDGDDDYEVTITTIPNKSFICVRFSKCQHVVVLVLLFYKPIVKWKKIEIAVIFVIGLLLFWYWYSFLQCTTSILDCLFDH